MASKTQGFTLAEMLIALALIGVIAAMMIPKVLSSTGDKQDVAKLKTAVSTVERAFYEASNDPDYTGAGTMGPYLQNKLSATLITAAATINGITGNSCQGATSAYQFPDGTLIAFKGTTLATNLSEAVAANQTTYVCIDTNYKTGGTTAPGAYVGTFTHAPNTPRRFVWTNGNVAAGFGTTALTASTKLY